MTTHAPDGPVRQVCRNIPVGTRVAWVPSHGSGDLANVTYQWLSTDWDRERKAAEELMATQMLRLARAELQMLARYLPRDSVDGGSSAADWRILPCDPEWLAAHRDEDQ